jgi:putative FmdB family regulatory protein
MPTYSYVCTHCNKEWDRLLKIADMETPISEPCPSCGTSGNIYNKICAPAFSDSMKLGLKKADSGFTDVLRRIHERSPGSQIDKASSLANI